MIIDLTQDEFIPIKIFDLTEDLIDLTKEEELKEELEKELEVIFIPTVKCAICLCDHMFIISIVTSCGHCFGRDCYNEYHTKIKNNQKVMTCPLCRSIEPSISEKQST